MFAKLSTKQETIQHRKLIIAIRNVKSIQPNKANRLQVDKNKKSEMILISIPNIVLVNHLWTCGLQRKQSFTSEREAAHESRSRRQLSSAVSLWERANGLHEFYRESQLDIVGNQHRQMMDTKAKSLRLV